MDLRILLGILGQLLAVPAALFLLPTSPPDLGGAESASSSQVDPVDDVGLKGPQEHVVKDRLVGVAVSATGAARRKGGNAASMRGGEGSIFATPSDGEQARPFAMGLEELRDGFQQALGTFMEVLNEMPRRAGDAFMSLTGRGEQQAEREPEIEGQARYLEELRLAQESAEKALSAPGWAEVAQRNGVTVWKKYFPKDEYGYQYPCVKASGIIDGAAEDVMGMIVDSTRVLEYNRYSKGRTDIAHLGPQTKIVWNKAQPPLSSKLHDFCTLMHVEPMEDGAYMLITRATEHPEAPLLDGHVRSEILLGVTILRPTKGDPARTEMTTVNHIVSNGVPVLIADRVSTKNAIDFIQNVETAALAAAAEGRASPLYLKGGDGKSPPSPDSVSDGEACLAPSRETAAAAA